MDFTDSSDSSDPSDSSDSSDSGEELLWCIYQKNTSQPVACIQPGCGATFIGTLALRAHITSDHPPLVDICLDDPNYVANKECLAVCAGLIEEHLIPDVAALCVSYLNQVGLEPYRYKCSVTKCKEVCTVKTQGGRLIIPDAAAESMEATVESHCCDACQDKRPAMCIECFDVVVMEDTFYDCPMCLRLCSQCRHVFQRRRMPMALVDEMRVYCACHDKEEKACLKCTTYVYQRTEDESDSDDTDEDESDSDNTDEGEHQHQPRRVQPSRGCKRKREHSYY